MENLKNRYDFIIGFVGIIISLSAFKDELSKINIDLGFIDFALDKYFLVTILGFLLSLYFYVIERALRDTKLGQHKIFDYFINIAYAIFILILASPVLILLSYLINIIVQTFGQLPENIKSITSGSVSFVLGIISSVIAKVLVDKYLKQKKDRQQEELESQEIRELEIASRLLHDGYYSQAILEAFKVLELHLFKQLKKRDIRVQKNRFADILQFSQSNRILNNDDLNIINEIRDMRNSAAHLDIQHTEEQAEKALLFIKNLIKRNA